MTTHHYTTKLTWQGNLGKGTANYRAYARDFVVQVAGKPDILGSSDPAFLGDKTRWNPEDMLLASISACHKLWYLHLCAVNHIVVIAYEDVATAVMDEGDASQAGHFVSATLAPVVTISQDSDSTLAYQLHKEAHQACFIANSLNFTVSCQPRIIIDGQ